MKRIVGSVAGCKPRKAKRVVHMLAGCLLAVLSVGALPAQANVEMVTAVQKVVIEEDDQGNTVRKLVSADQVVPGDTLHYVISFTNKGAQVIDDGSIVITNPLPPDTVYLEGTAQGSGTEITYSTDSGNSFGTADDLTVSVYRHRQPTTRRYDGRSNPLSKPARRAMSRSVCA